MVNCFIVKYRIGINCYFIHSVLWFLILTVHSWSAFSCKLLCLWWWWWWWWLLLLSGASCMSLKWKVFCVRNGKCLREPFYSLLVSCLWSWRLRKQIQASVFDLLSKNYCNILYCLTLPMLTMSVGMSWMFKTVCLFVWSCTGIHLDTCPVSLWIPVLCPYLTWPYMFSPPLCSCSKMDNCNYGLSGLASCCSAEEVEWSGVRGTVTGG